MMAELILKDREPLPIWRLDRFKKGSPQRTRSIAAKSL
jgi:hypothetical protein